MDDNKYNLTILRGDGVLALTEDSKKVIVDYLLAKKAMEEAEKKLREQLMTAMEENNVLSIVTDEFTISYTGTTFAEKFNVKKFKEEHEDLYNSYIEMQPKSASIRFTPKKPKKR